MLCQKFAESWFNGRHIVARRSLRPFCLWHFAYLHLVDSPLAPGIAVGGMTAVPPVTWADIELASRICQLEYLEQLPAPRWKWPAQLSLFVTMARSTLEKETAAFYGYINDFFSPPRFNKWKSDKSSIVRGSPPDPLSVSSACIMMFGGGPPTEKFVWEMPIGMAYWYASTLHYNRGAPLDYITARQEAFRAYLRKLKAEGKLQTKPATPESTLPADIAAMKMRSEGKIL